MTEAHKLARELAKRAALNSKSIAYLDKKLNVMQSHNFTGRHFEKFVYENGKVVIYDNENKKIETKEVKKAKSKPSQKLPDSADEKSS